MVKQNRSPDLPKPALSLLPIVALAAAAIIAIVFSLQYAWLTTFPIGGDAPDYVSTAVRSFRAMPDDLGFIWKKLTGSAYPLTHIIFSSSALVPISWPGRFVWWTIAGHLITSLSLGVLLYRISGWRSAASGIIIWSLATTTINNHFEDGTLAQLLSLPFLIWFFIHFFAGHTYRSLLFLILSFLTHPVSGLIAVATIASSTPQLLILSRQFNRSHRSAVITYAAISIVMILASAAIVLFRLGVFRHISTQDDPFSLIDIIRSFFGPFVLIAPIGFLIVTRWLNTRPLTALTIINFSLISLFTSLNHLLEINLWTFRFQTYLILSISILSALALPRLSRLLFSHRPLRLAFIFLLFASVIPTAWEVHAKIYGLYESPSQYHRLHPEEIAAIDWINTTLTDQHLIVTSTATRHAEWIESLTDHPWKASNSPDDYFNNINCADPQPPSSPYYYLVFKKVERLTWDLTNYPHAKQVFTNTAVDIYLLEAYVNQVN